MNTPLTLLICHVLIVVSRAQNETDKLNETASRNDEVNLIELSNMTKSSLAILQNMTKHLERDTSAMAALLPMVSHFNTTTMDIGHTLKNLFGSNGIQLMTSALTSSDAKSENNEPYINQSTTECRSRSSTTFGGMNCVTKGFTVGGLSTILMLLSLAMAMRIAQPATDVNTMMARPKTLIGHHMTPINRHPRLPHLPSMQSPNNPQMYARPLPPIPATRAYTRPQHNFVTTIPLRSQKVHESRKFSFRSIENSNSIGETEESDEISQQYE